MKKVENNQLTNYSGGTLYELILCMGEMLEAGAEANINTIAGLCAISNEYTIWG